MVINHPTVFKFAIFDFGPLMYGSSTDVSFNKKFPGNTNTLSSVYLMENRLLFSIKNVMYGKRQCQIEVQD